jgi:phosphohistidine phosphatase
MPAGGATAKPAVRARRTLYLVRHAIAADRGDKYPDDAKRPLTHKGIARMRQAVRGLRTTDPAIDLVLTSPYARARQTAEILVAGLSPSPALEALETLAPGQPPAGLADALRQYASHKTIALVGHEPDLGVLAAWLIGAREPLVFKKGGIARIEVTGFPPGRDGQLVWLATPGMLRGLS